MFDVIPAWTLWLIPGCPLAAAVFVAFFGRTLCRCGGHQPVISALAISCGLSLANLGYLAQHTPAHAEPAAQAGAQDTHAKPPEHVTPEHVTTVQFDWISVGGLKLPLVIGVDALSAVMLAMVTFVSLLVAVYSSGYMQGDPGYSRFFAELSLFVFSMCMLVMARNFVVLFIFWEAVGLCSYLLIGFWFEKPSAAAAARKAFIFNRIGDAAFLIGIFLIWSNFGSLQFDSVFSRANGGSIASEPMFWICLCLFIGACGKSAQFPLHLWLPDAMEGPTPVSALIHAATMVTAGVYLVARATPLFVHAPEVQATVATIGAITALLAALIGLTQTDLKRVLAYSTVSQLGYMFMALGSAAAGKGVATAAVIAAMFHMFTHAFFKALLFLSSGNVMHSMGHVIDMRHFGGLKRVLPVTNVVFLCGAAALAGLPLLSGFWSKDEILGLLLHASRHSQFEALFTVLFIVALVTAALTPFYTFRAYFKTFHGDLRIPDEAFAHAHHAADPHGHGHHGDEHHAHDPANIHEGPAAMKWPLMVLAVFALGVGLAVGPTHLFASWIARTGSLPAGESHAFDWLLAGGSSLVAILGVAVAAWMYARPTNVPAKIARKIRPLYKLSLNKFYLDELAGLFVAFPTGALAFLSYVLDQGLIDRTVDGLGRLPARVGQAFRATQSGFVQSYALVMFCGLTIFLTTITILQQILTNP